MSTRSEPLNLDPTGPRPLRGLARIGTALGLCLAAQGQDTSLISVSSAGAQADGESRAPSVSGDGRLVAFESSASSLVPGDTNGQADIFLHDLPSGAVSLISRSPGGQGADGGSSGPELSPSGRYLVYSSHASNLVAGDSNGQTDVFLHDRKTGVTELVSVASSGGQGDGASSNASVTGDGRYVVFQSEASNLVPDDTNGATDVFVRDREQGLTTRVSLSSTGVQATAPSMAPDVSQDGRLVAFTSKAGDLVAGDDNGHWDVFLHDRLTSETSLVSKGQLGEPADQGSWHPSIAADGSCVAYFSLATNLVPGDLNGERDVFVCEVQSGQSSLVSVNAAGEQTDGGSGDVELSQDGRYVTFSSHAKNLVPGDTNSREDVFVHDRQTGEVRRVSVGPLGQEGDAGSEAPVLSPEGRWVVFRSESDALLGEDANGHGDIFLHGPMFDEDPGPLDILATLDLFAIGEADVRHSHVDGLITAGDHINLLHFSSAQRSDLAPDSDVIISGGSLKARHGVVLRGNGVYTTDLDLDPTVVFVDSSQAPRVDSPLDFEAIAAAVQHISTQWGLTPPTGTTTIESNNITLVGSEPDVNFFLVHGTDLEQANMVTVSAPPGAACVINVDGGVVHKFICGIWLNGTAAENVMFNFFEGGRIVLGNWNLEASVMAPFAKLTVTTILVSGNLIAKHLRLQNAGTQGVLFSTEPWKDPGSGHLHGGEDGTDTPGYTLTWTPGGVDEQVHVVHQPGGVLELWVDGELERRVRLGRLERLVFIGRSDLSKIQIDPEITLPVELTGLAPVAQDDHASLAWGGSATADVLANDLAGPTALDPSSVQVLTAARYGTVTVDPTTGAVTYACLPALHRPAGLRGEVLEYVVRDVSGNPSTPRRVRFSFEPGGSSQLGRR